MAFPDPPVSTSDGAESTDEGGDDVEHPDNADESNSIVGFSIDPGRFDA
jgi:hypothetical protein